MNKKIYFLGIVIIIIICLFFLFIISKNKSVVEDINEIDFLPKCGNGICEDGETTVICCQDCGCNLTNTHCDIESGYCKLNEINMSLDFMKRTYQNYKNNSKEIIDEEMLAYTSEMNGILTKDFCVAYMKKDGITMYNCISIDKDGNVLREYNRDR